MYVQVEKSKENKSRIIAQKKSKNKQDFQFIDNRPTQLAGTFGKSERFQNNFTTKTGLEGINLSGKSSKNKQKIANALNAFMQQWDAESIAKNLTRAYQSLSDHLATVNIRYRKNAASKDANPDVPGFWIGDTIDLLNQLHKYSQPGATGFLPTKFWKNITNIRNVMMSPDD